MNLPQLHQRPQSAVTPNRSYGLQEHRTIALDIGVRVVWCQSKIQRLAAVTGGDATLARAESMHQPWDAGERPGTKNFDGLGG